MNKKKDRMEIILVGKDITVELLNVDGGWTNGKGQKVAEYTVRLYSRCPIKIKDHFHKPTLKVKY